MRSAWLDLRSKVKIHGTPLVCTQEDCRCAAQEIGLRDLPPSYIDYVSIFGAGSWAYDLVIAVPRHTSPALTLPHRAASFKECVSYVISNPPHYIKEPDVVLSLICFGGSGNGHELCWDPSRIDSSGEMAICIVTHEESDIFYCGDSLLVFLRDYWVGGKIDDVFKEQGTQWGPRAEFVVSDGSGENPMTIMDEIYNRPG